MGITLIDAIENTYIYTAVIVATGVVAFNLGMLIGSVWVGL